jgi:archaellum biogenesis ATPase FlaH
MRSYILDISTQAKASKEYFLHRIIIGALSLNHFKESHNGEMDELLNKITHLLEDMNGQIISITVIQETLSEAFIRPISNSVKSGIRME